MIEVVAQFQITMNLMISFAETAETLIMCWAMANRANTECSSSTAFVQVVYNEGAVVVPERCSYNFINLRLVISLLK